MKRFLVGLMALAFITLGCAEAYAQAAPFTANRLRVASGTKTATAVAGAVTLSKSAGVITTEALTTAAAAIYTLTITNTVVAAADQCFASTNNGTNTQGATVLQRVTPGAGTVVIIIKNVHASEALNGTLKISFLCLKN